MQVFDGWIGALILLTGAAVATALLIALSMPLLERYALARPNARSSHTVPTPQGGGMAIVAVVLAVMGLLAGTGAGGFDGWWVVAVAGGMLVLAVVGAVDDIRPLPVLPRLALQFMAAVALVATLPPEAQALPWLPWVLERLGLVIALVWFINLTNFMDGIDWMTVVEAVPVLALLIVLGVSGQVGELAIVAPVAIAVLGGVIGFAPYNRHVARLFLGDVGSLPLGAVMGWLLIVLATAGHAAAALILPLYFLADATFTLAWRFARGERISQAHRSHFYQTAVARGMSVPGVTGWVLGLNIFLAMLAWAAVQSESLGVQLLLLLVACAATAAVMRYFACGRFS